MPSVAQPNKSVMLHFRVAEAEARQIKAEAQREGLSLSDYLRRKVTGPVPLVGNSKPAPRESQDLEALAAKIRNRDGVPMRVARARAKKEMGL